MYKTLGNFLAITFIVMAAFQNAAAQQVRPEDLIEGKPLKDWIASLEDKKPQVRVEAATVLGRIGFKARPAMPALIEHFKDEDETVCHAAAMALSSIANVADLIKVLGNSDARVRRWGAVAVGDLRRALGGMHPANINSGQTRDKLRNELKGEVPALIEALKDKNGAVRSEVISALGAIGPPASAAVPRIRTLLQDPSSSIRRTAASALWWIESDSQVAVPILIEGLEDTRADLLDRQTCVYVLGEMGPKAEAAVPALIVLLRGIQKSIRTETSVELSSNATEALGRIGEPAVPALTILLGDKDPDICKNAAWALRKMGPKAKAAVPALCKMSRESDVELRRFAVGALGKIGPEAHGAVTELIERLQDSDWKIRGSAIWALGSIGSDAKDSVPVLIALLKGMNEEARAPAIWALGKIGRNSKAAIPALIESAKTDREHGLAAEALGRIGSDAKPAVPILLELLDQSTAQARIRIALAHWRITGHEETAVKVLSAALADKQSSVRCDAAEALGEMGSRAKAAIPALIAMAKMNRGEDQFLDREAAIRALKIIEPQTAKNLGGP